MIQAVLASVVSINQRGSALTKLAGNVCNVDNIMEALYVLAVTKPHIYRVLGRAVTALRRKSGITQQQLADAIGISRASVANIERGEQRVFLDQVVSIASFFDVGGVDELLSSAQLDQRVRQRVNLSGDRLNRAQRREVNQVLEELTAEDSA